MSLIDVLEGVQQSDPRVFGVIAGVVTNNNDPEKLGRVMVTIPAFGDAVSGWARIAAPAAGKNRGAWFLPEVDDEVLVAFEHGDIRFPYVLGAVWTSKAPPPEDIDAGGANRRSITSRSGHVIRLDDTKDKEKIEIVDKTGKNQIVITSSDNGLSIAADGDIVISSASGSVTIKGKDVTIKASGSAKIEATSGLDLKASGKATLKGATVAIN